MDGLVSELIIIRDALNEKIAKLEIRVRDCSSIRNKIQTQIDELRNNKNDKRESSKE